MIKSFWQNYKHSGVLTETPSYDRTQIIYVNTFSLVGTAAFFIFGILHLVCGKLYLGLLECAIVVAAVANVLVLRKTLNYKRAGSNILFVMLFALQGLFLDGGLAETGIYWFYTFPLLAFFLKGKKGGICWVACLYLLTGITSWLVYLIGLKTLVYSYVQIQQLFMSLLAVSTLVYFYEKIRDENEKTIQESQKQMIEKTVRDEEIKLAENLQRSLLPRTNLTLPEIDFVGYYQPSLGVSGDYYDFFKINDKQIAAVLCDVSGKGIPAAFVMVNIRAVFKTLIKRYDENLLTTAYALNTLMVEEVGNDMFTTLFAMIYSIQERELTFFNAGHGPLSYYNAKNQRIEEVDMLQLPLGIVEEFPLIEEVKVKLCPGDVIVLFSDGITDSCSQKNEEFGKERLFEIIKQSKDLPAKDICRAVIKKLKYFSKNAVQRDDISLIIAKVK